MSRRGTAVQFRALLAIVSIGCTLAGCQTPEAHFPRIINEAAPLPPEVRARFGNIGLLPVSPATNSYFYAPPDRAEVFDQVSGRAFDWTYDHADGGHGAEGLASKITASTIAAVTGGVLASIIKGVPPEEFERSQDALRNALADESLSDGIQRQLLDAIAAARLPNVQVIPEAAAKTNDLAAYASRGIHTLLEIHVVEVSFEMKGGFNPDIAFSPQVVVSLRSAADGTHVYSRYFEYRGEQRKFTTWAADDARAFRTEVSVASREFARAILNHLIAPADAPR